VNGQSIIRLQISQRMAEEFEELLEARPPSEQRLSSEQQTRLQSRMSATSSSSRSSRAGLSGEHYDSKTVSINLTPSYSTGSRIGDESEAMSSNPIAMSSSLGVPGENGPNTISKGKRDLGEVSGTGSLQHDTRQTFLEDESGEDNDGNVFEG
jgi:hypothetical protein